MMKTKSLCTSCGTEKRTLSDGAGKIRGSFRLSMSSSFYKDDISCFSSVVQIFIRQYYSNTDWHG